MENLVPAAREVQSAGGVGIFGTMLANRYGEVRCATARRLLVSTWPARLEGLWAADVASADGIEIGAPFEDASHRTPSSSVFLMREIGSAKSLSWWRGIESRVADS